MNNGIKLRIKIYHILLDVHKFSLTIDNSFIKNKVYSLNKRDIAFINNVSMNSMRYFFHTNKILDIYTKKRPGLNERILICSAITQIVFLDFKSYAVINSTVEVAKKIKKFHGFVNAVLKKISADKGKLKNINIEYSDLPLWFQKNTQNLTKFYKENFLNSFFHEPDLHIVFKNKKYLSSFKEDIFPTSESSGFFIKRKKIIDIPSFKKGNWWVQDFSSSFPLTCIENKIIEKQSIDLCAAPGGKSFQIISKGENIILNDKNKERIKLLEENLKRLKYKAKIINNDVTSLNDKEKYNFIILDAPCSAVGTIRKNPEIFFKSEEPKLSYLVELQKKMLDKAASITKKNGIILYMVCSFLQIETTNQVKNFLKRNNTFSTYKFSNNNKSLYYDNLIKDNLMFTLPTKISGYNIDGYFAVYLKKIK